MAKLEKTQTEAWARSKSEELPKSKAKDQTRGSASAQLTRLWDFCSRFTPREQRRDQPERLRGTLVRTRCGVPPGGRGDASPQGLGFHGSAALERQLLHLVGTASAGLGPWASSFILQNRRRCPGQPRHATGLPALCHPPTSPAGGTRPPNVMQQGWTRETYVLVKDTWKRGAERPGSTEDEAYALRLCSYASKAK